MIRHDGCRIGRRCAIGDSEASEGLRETIFPCHDSRPGFICGLAADPCRAYGGRFDGVRQ